MSFYSIVKNLYKGILPHSIRKTIFKWTPIPIKRGRWFLLGRLEKSAEYDEIYDEKYYTDGLDATYKKSCEVIAESIVTVFAPKSIVDVGCGPGQLLLALKKRGVLCRGLDYSSASLKLCREKGLDVMKFDLRHDTLPKDSNVNLVVSTEVAEHLPEDYADHFVDILCALADDVVMTAAEPAVTYVGDHTHVNEQPKEYWIDKFEDRGFKYNVDITTQFHAEWKKAQIKPWFVQHLMVFSKESCSS